MVEKWIRGGTVRLQSNPLTFVSIDSPKLRCRPQMGTSPQMSKPEDLSVYRDNTVAEASPNDIDDAAKCSQHHGL